MYFVESQKTCSKKQKQKNNRNFSYQPNHITGWCVGTVVAAYNESSYFVFNHESIFTLQSCGWNNSSNVILLLDINKLKSIWIGKCIQLNCLKTQNKI